MKKPDVFGHIFSVGDRLLMHLVLESAEFQTESAVGHREIQEYLINGARAGVETLVSRSLELGAIIDKPQSSQPYGITAIAAAAEAGECAMIRMLVAKGADINAETAKGANIHAKEKRGQTALSCAVASEKRGPELIQTLLDLGVDVNVRDSRYNDETPLIAAARLGTPDIVELLIDRGADVNAVTTNGGTALSEAIQIGHQNPNTMFQNLKLLVDAGANISAVNQHGQIPLHPLVPFLATADREDQLIEALSLLLGPIAHGNANIRDQSGQTPLQAAFDAVASDRVTDTDTFVEIVQLFLDRGASLDIRDKNGRTALHAASRARWTSGNVLRLLIKQGLNVNEKDLEGNTPLMHAVQAGSQRDDSEIHHEIFDRNLNPSTLVDNGADARAADNSGNTALHCLAAGPAGVYQCSKLFTLLQDMGAEVNSQNHQGLTPLMVVVEKGRYWAEIWAKGIAPDLRLLVERGADLEIKTKDGLTVLLRFIGFCSRKHSGSVVIANFLMLGANTEARDQFGLTALLLAVARGWPKEIISLLVDQGADIYATDYEGKNVFHHATYDEVKIFLKEKWKDGSRKRVILSSH